MESENAKKLSLLIGFLRADAKLPDSVGNVSLAAADYLSDHFLPVVSRADGYDEADAQTAYDAEKMKA